MGTLIRWLTLVALAVVVYMIFTQAGPPGRSGLAGTLAKLRLVARKARLVALLYVLVIVISAVLRLMFGWSL
jgi:NADH:ubiquinone oxidoreductase subunit 4 (subunit M)